MAMVVMWGGTAAATSGGKAGAGAQLSGAREFGDEVLGSNITECPQAGLNNQSLRRTEPDAVEELSDRGDDIRLNQDYACMPQDEMSIAVNPLDTENVFGGANDYRLGWGSSGFYVTTDSSGSTAAGTTGRDGNEGRAHYDGIAIFPTPGSYPTPRRRRITSTEAATRSRSSIVAALPTTGRSTSSVRTTRAGSSSTARRTAASPGAGRAFPTPPESAAATAIPASRVTAW